MMEQLNRSYEMVTKVIAVSIIEWSSNHYELAVMNVERPGHEVIDESVFKDVFEATTPMEVYGIIEHIIKPAYLD